MVFFVPSFFLFICFEVSVIDGGLVGIHDPVIFLLSVLLSLLFVCSDVSTTQTRMFYMSYLSSPLLDKDEDRAFGPSVCLSSLSPSRQFPTLV